MPTHSAHGPLLGLTADLADFATKAAQDPLLGPLAVRLRGLKPPRFPTVFEALVNGVACQQLSLAVGIHLLNRLTADRLTTQGKGESAPVTGDDCKKMGPEAASNKKLVACLQPDRRVEIEVLGSRQLAGEAPAAGGATSAPAGTGGGSAPSGGEKKN